MRKTTVHILVLALIGASAVLANPDPAPPTNLYGADSMRGLVLDIIAACDIGGAAGTLGNSLSYVGNGSSAGGRRMSPVAFGPNGDQQVTPQSRFLSALECDAVASGRGEGIQIGLGGVAVLHDGTEGSECETLRYAGCMPVQDLNAATLLGFGNGVAGIDDGTGALLGTNGNAAIPLVNGQYCFTHWADALRILYTGQHAHLDDSSLSAACNPSPPPPSLVTSRRCNSDVRRTLVETWNTLFDLPGDDGAGGGCGEAHCTRLSHAFRPDDFSGITDTFLSLIGAPSVGNGFNVRSFCNGLENEDLDPIRRPCATNSNAALDPETVCAPIPFANRQAPFGADGSPSGQAGSVAPTAPKHLRGGRRLERSTSVSRWLALPLGNDRSPVQICARALQVFDHDGAQQPGGRHPWDWLCAAQ